MQSQIRIILLLCVTCLLSCGDDDPRPVGPDTPSSSRYSLGILREYWTIASPPIDLAQGEPLPTRGLFDPALAWFNPYDPFSVSDIYDTIATNGAMDVLILQFDPAKSRLFDSTQQNQRDIWAGIINGLPRVSWDQSRAEYIEFRMGAISYDADGFAGSRTDLGTLHIDLGRINEDVDLNGLSNTEDMNGNGTLEVVEDTGLDGVPDSQEDIDGDGRPDTVWVTLPDGSVINDPAGDDWWFRSDYKGFVERINGTEGNVSRSLLGGPDSEDVGGVREFDHDNAYYTFVIDLSDPDNYVIEGSERASQQFPQLTWRTYRIPLWSEATLVDLDRLPDSTYIEYARLWFDNAPQRMDVYIAAQDIVSPPPDDSKID